MPSLGEKTDSVVFAIDPTGFYVYFWTLVALASLCGAMIYLLPRRSGLRTQRSRAAASASIT
jgi:hypothetical protein